MFLNRESFNLQIVRGLILLGTLNIALFSHSDLFCKEAIPQKKGPPYDVSKEIQMYKVNDDYSLSFEKPKFWDFITLTPKTFKTFYKDSVSPDGLKGLAWIEDGVRDEIRPAVGPRGKESQGDLTLAEKHIRNRCSRTSCVQWGTYRGSGEGQGVSSLSWGNSLAN